jgi:hypothetical protein
MNSDDLMSDPAAPMSESQQHSSKAAAWNTKKFREEYDMYKNRLQDQKFSMGVFEPRFISHIYLPPYLSRITN